MNPDPDPDAGVGDWCEYVGPGIYTVEGPDGEQYTVEVTR